MIMDLINCELHYIILINYRSKIIISIRKYRNKASLTEP